MQRLLISLLMYFLSSPLGESNTARALVLGQPSKQPSEPTVLSSDMAVFSHLITRFRVISVAWVSNNNHRNNNNNSRTIQKNC